MIAEQKKMLVTERLVKIMEEAKAIGKDSKNVSQGFMFRGIDAVMNHLHPIFAKHGVIVLPEVLEDKSEDRQTQKGSNLIYRIAKIKFHFVGADGDEVCATVMGEGMDSGDKAMNKAMAVALKYALTQMLLLPYDEVDPDGESHEPSTKTTQLKPAEKPAPAKVNPNTEVNTSDVVGKQGTMIMEEMPEVKQRDGTNKNGKPYTRFYFKNQADGIYYSTFDRNLSDEMKTLQGQRVEASFKEGINLTSRDVVGICIIRESSPETEVFNDKNAVGDDQLPF